MNNISVRTGLTVALLRPRRRRPGAVSGGGGAGLSSEHEPSPCVLCAADMVLRDVAGLAGSVRGRRHHAAVPGQLVSPVVGLHRLLARRPRPHDIHHRTKVQGNATCCLSPCYRTDCVCVSPCYPTDCVCVSRCYPTDCVCVSRCSQTVSLFVSLFSD